MDPYLRLPEGIRGGEETYSVTPARRSLGEENRLRIISLSHQQLMDELVSISATIYAVELLLSHISSVSENEQGQLLANAQLYQRLAEDQQVSVARIQRRYHPWDMMKHLLQPRQDLLRHQYRECRAEFDRRQYDGSRRAVRQGDVQQQQRAVQQGIGQMLQGVVQQGDGQQQQRSARTQEGPFNTHIPITPPPPYYP